MKICSAEAHYILLFKIQFNPAPSITTGFNRMTTATCNVDTTYGMKLNGILKRKETKRTHIFMVSLCIMYTEWILMVVKLVSLHLSGPLFKWLVSMYVFVHKILIQICRTRNLSVSLVSFTYNRCTNELKLVRLMPFLLLDIYFPIQSIFVS